jgi:hypothetical protein
MVTRVVVVAGALGAGALGVGTLETTGRSTEGALEGVSTTGVLEGEALGAKMPPGFEGTAVGCSPVVVEERRSTGGDPPDVPQLPVGGDFVVESSSDSTTSPAFGTFRMVLTTCVQSVFPGRLATSMSGSWLKPDSSLAPPLTSMGAQFM